MRAAFAGVDNVDKGGGVFLKGVIVLDSDFGIDTGIGPVDVDGRMKSGFTFVYFGQ